MPSLYRPIAKIHPPDHGVGVNVKSLGQQSCLKSFCRHDKENQPSGFDGLASLHFETNLADEPHRVRVEIQGRTIGFLGSEDAEKLAEKLMDEGLGLYPVLVTVKVRAGSLRDEGPPYFYFAELLVDLSLENRWTFEPLSESEFDSGDDPSEESEEGPRLPSHSPSHREAGEIATARRNHALRSQALAGEVFGRGLGILILMIFFLFLYSAVVFYRGGSPPH